MNNIYYLSHGGPGSGRYPLGSGERPYQKFEGSGNRRSGIVGYIKSRKAKKLEERRRKSESEALKQKEELIEKRQLHEKDRERVLREGTAKEVLKYQGELSNKELYDAAERLRLERQIKSYSEQEIKTTLDKLQKIQNYTNVGSSLARDGIDLWNSFALIYNVTDNGKKEPIPLIGRRN